MDGRRCRTGCLYGTVIRNSIRYGNLDILEDGYGINMMPLAAFAMEVYGDDPCQVFEVHGNPSINALEKRAEQENAQSHFHYPV